MIAKKAKNIIAWCFSIFCILSIFTLGPSLGTVLLLICGILALPIKPIKALWEKYVPKKAGWLKVISLCLAFFIGCAITPTSTEGELPPDNPGIETTDSGISSETDNLLPSETDKPSPETASTSAETTGQTNIEDNVTSTAIPADTKAPETQVSVLPETPKSFDYNTIPTFDEKNPYCIVNNNIPYFTPSQYNTTAYESYSKRDSLNRCGTAIAIIGTELMPSTERGSIGMVKPSGWQTVKYDCVDGNYLYNRCHLIGYQLTGENSNEDNLITGTRFMNNEGMLPFENMVADYIKETNNHVIYRVTPIFINNELLARGVLMEAYSIEDNGAGICFNVFCYNAQPKIEINYSNGESKLIENAIETLAPETQPPSTSPLSPETTPKLPETDEPKPIETEPILTEAPETEAPTPEIPAGTSYVVNINPNSTSKKFHYPDCGSVKQMAEKNKWFYTGTADELIALGYTPCKNCNP